jgi:hypothetical protein
MNFTDIPVSNIFRTRNDWHLTAMKCRRVTDNFETELVRIIKDETDYHPYKDVEYRGGRQCRSRQLFLAMMVKYTSKSLRSIGSIVGKDHATVIHAVKAVNNDYDTDIRFRDTYNRIDKKIKLLKR